MEGRKEETLLPSTVEMSNKTFQSWFYMLNGKPDSKTKIFNNYICVNLASIDDLNDRVSQKLKSHYDENNSSSIININITFRDGRSINYSGWDEYKKTKINNPSAIINFTITWDCFLKLPNYEIPQRHKLVVKITDGLRPGELLHLIFTGKLEEIGDISVDSPIVVSVDFIDYQIGDELINVIGEWVKTVDVSINNRNETNIKKLSKHKMKISRFLTWVTTTVAIICMYFCLRTSLMENSTKVFSQITMQEFNSWITIIFIGGIFCFLINRMTYYLSNNIFRILENQNEIHIFDITQGDKKEIENLKNNYTSGLKGIVLNTIGIFIMNLICGILATLISNFILVI